MLTAEQLVRRLVALIVPKGLHLTNFHGVFAPAAAARPTLASPAKTPMSSTSTLREKQRRPRIDWATLLHRTFGCDVWKCRCGGQRRVVALVTNRRTVEQLLANMGLLHPSPPLPAAQGPPQRDLLYDC